MVVPEPRDGVDFMERIGPHDRIIRAVGGQKYVTFFVERPRDGWQHPCSVDDIVYMLEHVPEADWAGLDIFVLRQPTRKQVLLKPVWGRLLYNGELRNRLGHVIARGPAVLLEAVEDDFRLKWGLSLDPEDSSELDRLRADGHHVERTSRHHIVHVTPRSARSTQLYRTLLHELGHWFDWLSKIREPVARGGDFVALYDLYFARPRAEREAFAHRYADELGARLTREGVIPFEQAD